MPGRGNAYNVPRFQGAAAEIAGEHDRLFGVAKKTLPPWRESPGLRLNCCVNVALRVLLRGFADKPSR
jgi:hypothetical protein